MATVAQNIVETLHASGVRRMYGVPGDSLNGLTEALRSHGGIQWVHTRHEETAAFAASDEPVPLMWPSSAICPPDSA